MSSADYLQLTFCESTVNFDIDKEFQPGDTIGILPNNNSNEVIQILTRLNLIKEAKKKYHLNILQNTKKKNAAIPSHIPNVGTLYHLFLRHLDIKSPPKKLFLKMLMRYTSDAEEIETLKQLTSPDGSTLYKDFINTHAGLLNVLNAFPSCTPAIDRIIENLGPLQPRPYSISSSPLIDTLHFTFSVTELNSTTTGVCSGWLEEKITFGKTIIESINNLDLNSENDILFYFRHSNDFRLPHNCLLPIIMIGPGTGVAPYVGFLQHRKILNMQHNQQFGCSWLFYGCRYFDRDFLYKEEIDNFLQIGVLTKLFSCFSRDAATKVYVQDLIMENANAFIHKVVNENAIVYVCGDSKNMIQDVRSTIVNCLSEQMAWSLTESTSYFKQLQKNKRFIEDLWT
ncbi:hypothetical protein FQA39_LY08281 [Lamprigera yunnana]|nr:hypothetical protein FQA39_LY08281 [Lamprigera yunnana]